MLCGLTDSVVDLMFLCFNWSCFIHVQFDFQCLIARYVLVSVFDMFHYIIIIIFL